MKFILILFSALFLQGCVYAKYTGPSGKESLTVRSWFKSVNDLKAYREDFGVTIGTTGSTLSAAEMVQMMEFMDRMRYGAPRDMMEPQ